MQLKLFLLLGIEGGNENYILRRITICLGNRIYDTKSGPPFMLVRSHCEWHPLELCLGQPRKPYTLVL